MACHERLLAIGVFPGGTMLAERAIGRRQGFFPTDELNSMHPSFAGSTQPLGQCFAHLAELGA